MDIDVIDKKVQQLTAWKKEIEGYFARLRERGTLIGAPPSAPQGILDDPTESDAQPQGFFGSSGPSLPLAHTLEDLNAQIQSAGGVFDLSKIDIASFKAGFHDLVSRLGAVESAVPVLEKHLHDAQAAIAERKTEHDRLANASADAIEALQATSRAKPVQLEPAVDAQGNPVEHPGT
jgi:hypothetical protein